MGFFTKKSISNPKILTQGLEIQFNLNLQGWEFSYRGIDFVTFEQSLTLPTISQLDEILKILGALEPEINSRIEKGLKEWSVGAKTNSGERCLINIADFFSKQEITASYSEGKDWGDMAVDFIIKDRVIIDECWGD